MFSKDKRRHRQLMEVTESLVRKATMFVTISGGSDLHEQVTAEQVVAAAFGRFRMRVEEREAVEYLRAVLVLRGYSVGHLPLPVATAGEKGEA
jgi:hypothetical protein